MIMASKLNASDAKYVKSIQTIFSRAGTYGQPLELQVEPFHDGRTFGSSIITAWQGERLLSKSMVLSTADEADLISHQIAPPAGVKGPKFGKPTKGTEFPGAEVLEAETEFDTINGVPAMSLWMRMPEPVGSFAASQAVLAWSTNGWLIGLAMQPYAEQIQIGDAHHTLSTGVIGHTLHFHREFDAGSWMHIAQEASFAGKGRVHGRGSVFSEDGHLLATFSQDSMLKQIDAKVAGSSPDSRTWM
jgi:acyl-CoA thioesterase